MLSGHKPEIFRQLKLQDGEVLGAVGHGKVSMTHAAA